jgi:HEAT repeat protein
VGSAELSEAIVPSIRHPDPVVRRTAIFILCRRDYRPVQTQVVQALDDPDAVVRKYALAWPWNAYEKDHPEIRAKIKKMRGDPDAEVRHAAKLALASMSAWYRFWYLDR